MRDLTARLAAFSSAEILILFLQDFFLGNFQPFSFQNNLKEYIYKRSHVNE